MSCNYMVKYYGTVQDLNIRLKIRKGYRLLSGLSGLIAIVAIPILVSVLYIELYLAIHGGNIPPIGSFWGDTFPEIFAMLTVSLFVAVAAVYFLRFLFLVRDLLRTYWKNILHHLKPNLKKKARFKVKIQKRCLKQLNTRRRSGLGGGSSFTLVSLESFSCWLSWLTN